jgi:hypothetical protein
VADEFAALLTEQLLFGENWLSGKRDAEPDKADRLVRRTAARAGDAGDGKREAGL